MTASNSRTGGSGSQQTQTKISCSDLRVRDYEDPSMIKRFVPIAEAMRSSSDEELGFDSADISAKSLSLLTGQLRAFTETALGSKNVKKLPSHINHITKFPLALYSDYRPNGSLYVILCACLNYKTLHGLRRLEFQNPDKQTMLYDMLSRINKSLQKEKLLPDIRIFFTKFITKDKELSNLKNIIQKRASIVNSPNHATHIIYPDPKGTSLEETNQEEYCRPLKFNDDYALVHWWYYPDSYDSWLKKNEVDGTIEPQDDHQDKWHVQLRWLHDTDLFNEWMNEFDYEIPFDMRIEIPIHLPNNTSTPSSSSVPRSHRDRDRDLITSSSSRSNHPNSSSVAGHSRDRDRDRDRDRSSSKKRRRSTQTAPGAPSTTSNPTSRIAERDRHAADKEDEMDLGNSSNDSDAEIAKKSRRSSLDHPSKDKRSRDYSRKDSGSDGHPRKRSRVHEDRKKSSKRDGSAGMSSSVRLLLRLKPTSAEERSKDKSKDRYNDKEGRSSHKDRDRDKDGSTYSKGKDSSRWEGKIKESSKSKRDISGSDAPPVSSGLKLRVKLGGKVVEPIISALNNEENTGVLSRDGEPSRRESSSKERRDDTGSLTSKSVKSHSKSPSKSHHHSHHSKSHHSRVDRELDRERSRDRDKDRDRERDHDRERGRDRDKGRERDRDRDRDKDKDRERNRDRERRDRDRDRERDRDRDRNRDRDRDKDREQDREKERNRDNEPEHNLDDEQERERERERERKRELERERECGKKAENVERESGKTNDVEADPSLDEGKDETMDEKEGLEIEAVGGDNDEGDQGLDSKKPFSRRKRSRKERTQQNRAPGVTPVETVVPIPEGDVSRIRNISNEGLETSTTDAMDAENETGGSGDTLKKLLKTEDDAGGSQGDDLKQAKKAVVVHEGGDNSKMAIDTDNSARERQANDAIMKENAADDVQKNGRVVAVAEKMLTGGIEANAPASGADLVTSLSTVTVRMPAQARWFRIDAIHDIEKQTLPEFFDKRSQSKTPLVYKKYRDFMVDVWRQAPEKYLTATAARRHLAGDVCAILRVHVFLERWGLINYGIEPESKPYLSSSLKTRSSRPKPMVLDGPGGSGNGTSGVINGVPRLLFFDEPRPPKRDSGPVSALKARKNATDKMGRERTSLVTRRELYATAAATKYECDACGADCSRMRYHCVSNVDMELCPKCFANGMYPQTLSARDFEQLTTVLSSEAYDGSVWSEGEVLLLLEGLEKYGDDWGQVAEHVGTKSNEQCVLQFLRMPIEDSFLGDQLGKWDFGRSNRSNDPLVAQEDDEDMTDDDADKQFAGPYLPFADSSNPVMAQVAFLASCVSPEVAAAAAQAALRELLKEKNNTNNGNESEKAQAEALLEDGTSMTNPGGSSGTPSNLKSMPKEELDSVAVEAAASVGLAAAVVRSKQMADAEIREIEREFAVAVETKLRAVDMKIQEFERLEQHLRRDRDRMEKQRHGLFAARIDAAIARGGATTAPNVTHPHHGVPATPANPNVMAGTARGSSYASGSTMVATNVSGGGGGAGYAAVNNAAAAAVHQRMHGLPQQQQQLQHQAAVQMQEMAAGVPPQTMSDGGIAAAAAAASGAVAPPGVARNQRT